MIQTHVHSISVMSTLALLLTTLPVMAETDAFEVYSEAVGQSLSSIQVDDTGMTADADRWLSTRLILSAQHEFIEGLKVTASGELRLWRLMDAGSPLGLEYAADTFEHDRDADAESVRPVLHTLSLEYVTPVGLFRCGYQSAQWGTGMLVNNGRQERIFGDGWSGNRTGRCLYAARFGGGFTFFTGADYVFRDDNAEFVEDDRAYGWTAGLRYAFDGKAASETRQALSVLFAQRFQTDRSDPYHPVDERTTLDVNSVDIHFKWHRPISPTQTLAIESEFAALFGQTTRPFLEETFENGADILAAGGVLRLSSYHRVRRISKPVLPLAITTQGTRPSGSSPLTSLTRSVWFCLNTFYPLYRPALSTDSPIRISSMYHLMRFASQSIRALSETLLTLIPTCAGI